MNLLNKVAAAIAARATWKRAIILFVLTYTVYFFMLGLTIPAVEEYANGMMIFDLKPFGYTFSYAETLINNLGEEGISVYLTRQLPLDFLYPGCMGLTGAAFIALLVRKKIRNASYIICLPLIAGFMDYMENVMIIIMLRQSAELSIWAASAASIFTVLKSVLSTAYYVVLLFLLVVRFIQIIKHKSGGHFGQ
ncbi:hypothetical protein PaeBR_14130 [Paenibacillus sp. BR2-3]|uniref:hypothetical protein n=1 Tax=Paenibacillus sp. BR2-3 TaxID=3048494 RepID=UPI003977AB7F